MELTKCIAVLLCIAVSEITSTKDQNTEGITELKNKQNFNPLESLVLYQNESSESTNGGLVRVKRQYYDPYYYGTGPYYPIPIPIFVGGGIGLGFGRGFGGRGFGGRGFGGRGFGGRGFGGRGFGGRGIGGRGIGGFGGRGVGGIGGGRGGGRG